MPSNKEAVIQVVESAGEIGVAGVSARLRLDKGTVRKVALEAAREGRIGVRNDGLCKNSHARNQGGGQSQIRYTKIRR